MERRGFLRAAGGGLAGLAAGTGLGAAVSGCASMIAVPVRPEGGRVRLALADHPGLDGPAGFARLRIEGDGRLIYLLALEDGAYAALSPVCTHQGCTVDVQAQHLVCPCHGSAYSREGEVLRGPAPLPLRRYPVRVEPDGVLIIDMEAA